MNVPETVVGSILALAGVRSVVYWLRRPLASRSPRDHVLYALFLTGRIGVWFSLAGMFFAYAAAKHLESVRWLVIVPIVLAAVSTLSAFALGREGD